MKMPLVGVGIAGLVSAVAFALFPLEGSSPLKAGDLLDTFVLLGMTFAAVLIMAFLVLFLAPNWGLRKTSQGMSRQLN